MGHGAFRHQGPEEEGGDAADVRDEHDGDNDDDDLGGGVVVRAARLQPSPQLRGATLAPSLWAPKRAGHGARRAPERARRGGRRRRGELRARASTPPRPAPLPPPRAETPGGPWGGCAVAGDPWSDSGGRTSGARGARGTDIGGKRQVPGLERLPRHPGRRGFRPPSPEARRTRPACSPSGITPLETVT